MQVYKNEISKVAGKWTAWAFNPEAARLLNRRLRTYNVEGHEWGASEGVFKFEDKDLPFVRALLEKMGGLEKTYVED